MYSTQFKDPVSDMCIAGVVVASCRLTQEVPGSSPFNDKYFWSLNSLNSVKHSGKTPVMLFNSCIAWNLEF